MRCSCKVCEDAVWMIQAESDRMGCVCPECGYRCTDCLGTDTVVSREALAGLAMDPRFSPERYEAAFAPAAEADEWADERMNEGGYRI